MKRLIPILCILLLLSVRMTAQSSSMTSCTVGKDAAAFGFWTWPTNSTIKVYVVAEDFKDDELPFLLKPLETWSAVSEATGSGVKFDFIGPTTAALYCENCLTIRRAEVFDKVKRHATELRAYSARSNQIMTWAHILVDPVLKNPQALTNAIVHELGHNFGLQDCYGCKARSTVMIQFKVVNEPNGMEGPTACDIVQVKAAFKELAVRVRPVPKAEIVDEGEEPVDDDTPVVIKKP